MSVFHISSIFYCNFILCIIVTNLVALWLQDLNKLTLTFICSAAAYCSSGYMATASHFGMLTVWETGSLSMRHRCQHDVSVLSC